MTRDRREIREEPETPETGLDGGIDNDNSIVDSEFEERVRDFCIQDQVENESYHCTLYKIVRDPHSNKESNQQINAYANCIPPSRHEIGLEYGSGKYMVVISRWGKEKRSTSFRFSLHETYNEMKRKRDREMMIPPPAQLMNSLPPPPNMDATFGLFERMMSLIMGMLKPMLERSLNPVSIPEKPVDPLGMMTAFRDVLKKSAMEDVSFMGDVRRKFIEFQDTQISPLNSNDEPEETSNQEPNLLEKIIPIIETFLPLLVGNAAKAQAAAAGLRAIPQVKQAIEDISEQPETARRIAAYVVQKEGSEKASQILKLFGIDPSRYIPSGSVISSKIVPPSKIYHAPNSKKGKK